jgi:glycosyltransferase involved in cell wall biosynthesis
MKISVVVPVYNVEQCIERCIQSIVNQDYHNIEILLIDDGSTDSSPQICDNYAREYDNITVFHKKVNEGLSEARNTGIKAATGDYILFVDSDDSIDENTCQRFIDALNEREADLVVGNLRVVRGTDISPRHHKNSNCGSIVSGEEYLVNELEAKTMYMAVWLCLYATKFLRDNNLYFKYGILHEDEEFTPRVFLAAKRVIPTDIEFYNHIIREGSITTQKNLTSNAKSICLICNELKPYFDAVQNEKLKFLLKEHLVDISFKIFFDAKLYKKENKYLIDVAFLKRNAKSRKNRIRLILLLISKRLLYMLNVCRVNIRSLLRGERS